MIILDNVAILYADDYRYGNGTRLENSNAAMKHIIDVWGNPSIPEDEVGTPYAHQPAQIAWIAWRWLAGSLPD
jgi:hypothetical protein